MIQANELRIGNKVYYNTGEAIEIDTIDYLDIKIAVEDNEAFNLSRKPIPLTEEWLIKMGFVSNPYQDRYELNGIYIDCDKLKGFLQLWESRTGVVIQYVHQLQNLYYALTNEELTIKN